LDHKTILLKQQCKVAVKNGSFFPTFFLV